MFHVKQIKLSVLSRNKKTISKIILQTVVVHIALYIVAMSRTKASSEYVLNVQLSDQVQIKFAASSSRL